MSPNGTDARGPGHRFAYALRRLEQTRNIEEMARIFDPQATLRRIPQLHTYRGADGIRAFWRGYLALFEHIETAFTNVIEGDEDAVLEWCSRGRLRNGSPVEYEGVSVVVADPGGSVRHFRTYYDANAAIGTHAGALRALREARP